LLRVLIISDPKIKIPPIDYGGVERIVAYLGSGLQRAGYRVDLMANINSENFGGKLWPLKYPGKSFLSRFYAKALSQFISLLASRTIDVVINCGRIDYLLVFYYLHKPIIQVFHNPVSNNDIDWFLKRRNGPIRFIGVSNAQINSIRECKFLTVIHNSTDIIKFAYNAIPTNPPYLIFLGRLSKNKGIDIAIRVAKKAGLKLIIAGNISDEPDALEYFDQVIKPELNNEIEWIGPVNDIQKINLLGNAIATLFPIRWNEPFGIVMIESLSCGTPVIAMNCASVPEIIVDGKTGFLCQTEDDMVESIRKVNNISREECRLSAKNRFSIDIMVNKYIEVIEEISCKK
jgi:glycosyltransferase involved in cell wall biosynthesis